MKRKQARLAVLVADPSPQLHALVDRSLPGADVDHAIDAAGATERLQRRGGRTDLLLVDCRLPAGPAGAATGLELIATIAARFPLVAIAAMGPPGDEALVIDAIRRGARDYLRKPLGTGDVQDVARRLVGWGRPDTPAIRDVITFVEQHHMHTLPLEMLARMAGMSRWHFCRTFRTVTGLSLRRFLTEVRLARARALLETSTLTITEIAHEVGFYDLSHLDRAFRKRFGASPRAFLARRPLSRHGTAARRVAEPAPPPRPSRLLPPSPTGDAALPDVPA